MEGRRIFCGERLAMKQALKGWGPDIRIGYKWYGLICLGWEMVLQPLF
jgi:hypothetical protein